MNKLFGMTLEPFTRAHCLSLFVCLSALTGMSKLRAASWEDFCAGEEVAYFLVGYGAGLERFDIAADEWLEPMELDDYHRAIAGGDGGIYLASGATILRLDAETGALAEFATTSSSIREMSAEGGLIVAHTTSGSSSVNYLEVIDETLKERIRVRDLGSSTGSSSPTFSSRYWRVYYPSGRSFTAESARPDGRIPTGSQISATATPLLKADYECWVLPQAHAVIGSSGQVFSPDLVYRGDLGRRVDSAALLDSNLPLILSANKLFLYGSDLRLLSEIDLDLEPGVSAEELIVRGSEAIVFLRDTREANGIGVRRMELASLAAEFRRDLLLPYGLIYNPSATTQLDGVLYLLDRGQDYLFRFDTEAQRYLESIPLSEPCFLLTSDPTSGRLYLASIFGNVFHVDTQSGIASPHVVLPGLPDLIVAMGDELLASRDRDEGFQYLYNGNGDLLQNPAVQGLDMVYFYAPKLKRLYYDWYLIWREYLGNGEFGETGSVRFDTHERLLAVSPDGEIVMSKSGQITERYSPEFKSFSDYGLFAAQWDSASRLFTVEKPPPQGDQAQTFLRRWDDSLNSYEETVFPGSFLSFTIEDDRLTLVTRQSGVPTFWTLSTALQLLPPADLQAPDLALESYSATAVSLRWPAVFGAESYQLEHRPSGTSNWTSIAGIPRGTTHYLADGLASGETHEFRLRAVNGAIESGFSEAVAVDLSGTFTPGADPSVLRFSPDQVLVTESDVILLLSREARSIFRWSLKERKWLESIGLQAKPKSMAYSAVHNTVYVAYEDETISATSLNGAQLLEIPFAEDGGCSVRTLGGWILGGCYDVTLGSARRYEVRAWDASGRAVGQTLSTISLFGSKGAPGSEFLFKFGSQGGIRASVSDEGIWVPYPSSSSIHSPGETVDFWVKPEGNLVIRYNGTVFDGDSLYVLDDFVISDWRQAVWSGGSLYSLLDDRIQQWSRTEYVVEREILFSGDAVDLLPTSDNRLVLILLNRFGKLCFEVFDGRLNAVEAEVVQRPEGIGVGRLTESGVTIIWSDVFGEDAYEVERLDEDGQWVSLGSSGANETGFTDNDLPPTGEVSYRVSAWYGEIRSAPSEPLRLSSEAPEIESPVLGLSDSGEVHVSWASDSTSTRFAIERSESGGLWHSIASVAGGTTSFLDTEVEPNTVYQYRIVPQDILGRGHADASGVGEILVPGPIPDSPVYLSVYAIGSHRVQISRSSVNGASSYRLERQQVGSVEWETVALEGPYGSNVDDSLMADTEYAYRLIAINASGESAPSVTKTVRTLKPIDPPTPMLEGWQLSGHEVLLDWTDYLDVTGYNVYRKNDGETSWKLIGSVSDDHQFIDDTVAIGESFTYAVTSLTEKGESAFSAAVSVSLQQHVTIFEEDFDPPFDPAELASFAGSIAADGPTGIGSYYLGSGSSRRVRLPALDLSFGATIEFDLKAETDDAIPLSNNHFVNFGWLPSSYLSEVILSFDPASSSNHSWRRHRVELPEDAWGRRRTLEWSQLSHFSNPERSPWALDNIRIFREFPSPPVAPDYVMVAEVGVGTFLFWPSDSNADYYRIESSRNGSDWNLVGLVEQAGHLLIPTTSAQGNGPFFRVFAGNRGGWSAPRELSDPDGPAMQRAIAAGQREVQSNPDSFGLFLPESGGEKFRQGQRSVLGDPLAAQLFSVDALADAYHEGVFEVVDSPSTYGLFLNQKFSRLRYGDGETLEFEGDLRWARWSLQYSHDLSRWIELNLHGEDFEPNLAVPVKVKWGPSN
jgi:hypothetical protein